MILDQMPPLRTDGNLSAGKMIDILDKYGQKMINNLKFDQKSLKDLMKPKPAKLTISLYDAFVKIMKGV